MKILQTERGKFYPITDKTVNGKSIRSRLLYGIIFWQNRCTEETSQQRTQGIVDHIVRFRITQRVKELQIFDPRADGHQYRDYQKDPCSP